jgi:N-acyl homoserine lactone hydrolase
MRVHVVEVGRLQFSEGWFRSRSVLQILQSVLRGLRGTGDTIPILVYVVEHDEGHIIIDTGASHAFVKRLLAIPGVRGRLGASIEPDDEVGPKMRASGLRTEDVRLVVPTHLDFDHAGGIGHFPNAEVLIHRTEWECRNKLAYRFRFQPPTWSASSQPRLYDLAPEPYGPFDDSLQLTDDGDVVALPTPGHTEGHVAIAMRTPDMTLLFAGDHIIRQSWYLADLARGMQPFQPNQRLAADTNRKLQRFVEQFPTLLLPSHDAEAVDNLARWEPLQII